MHVMLGFSFYFPFVDERYAFPDEAFKTWENGAFESKIFSSMQTTCVKSSVNLSLPFTSSSWAIFCLLRFVKAAHEDYCSYFLLINWTRASWRANDEEQVGFK